MRKDEQETLIHYDVLTKQTTVIENDIVVAVQGYMLDGYSLSRKPRKNPELTDEQKYILVARLEQVRNNRK